MLLLILAHRDVVRLIEQNICRHQSGISEETGVDIVGVLGGFVLELGHTAELTEHGVAVQHPAQLSVGRHMALHEQGVLFGIQTAGNVDGQLFQRATTQIGGSLADSDGVHISHKVVAVVLLGPGGPGLDRTQIVAQVQIAAGLDAGQHYFLGSSFFFHDGSSTFRWTGGQAAYALNH